MMSVSRFSRIAIRQGYEVKYGIPVSNHYHLLKSLVYFEDAEPQPMPLMYAAVDWEDVKERIIAEVKAITFQ